MEVFFTVLTILFLFASLGLVIIILVQRPQGGGLSAAFGGSGSGGSDTAFGGRTGDALTVTTVTAFIVYLGLAIGLNIVDKELTRPAIAQPAATTDATGAPGTGAPATGTPVTGTGLPEGATRNADGTITLPGGGVLTPMSGPPPGAQPPAAQPPAQQPPAEQPPAAHPPAAPPPATPPAQPTAP